MSPKDEILSALLQLNPALGYPYVQIWRQTLLNALVPQQTSSCQCWAKGARANTNNSDHFLWAALNPLNKCHSPGFVLWDLFTLRPTSVSATPRPRASVTVNRVKLILWFFNQHPWAANGTGLHALPGECGDESCRASALSSSQSQGIWEWRLPSTRGAWSTVGAPSRGEWLLHKRRMDEIELKNARKNVGKDMACDLEIWSLRYAGNRGKQHKRTLEEKVGAA